MADTLVDSNIKSAGDRRMAPWGPYWISTTTGIIIFIDTGSDVSFARTTDGGVNWSTTEIDAGTTMHVAAWFDQETPGDSGTLVHVIFMDSAGTDTVRYRTVDISDGTLGTLRSIDATVTIETTNPSRNRIAITKARNGNLLTAFSTQTEIECYRSVDSGANWTTHTDVYEAATEEDFVLLFPANVDDGDVAALFWDRSADEISVKMYDDSANTWTETSILTSMVDEIFRITMDGAVRHSDGLILGVAHNNDDTTGDDLVTFTVNPDSIASPTIDTTTANIFTNQAESSGQGILINQQNDDVYVAYMKGGTWLDTVDIVYHLSTDDMASWGTEQAYSETTDDYRRVQAGRTVGNGGGFFQPCFYDDDDRDIYVNLVNDVAIVAVEDVFTAALQPGTEQPYPYNKEVVNY